MVAANTTLCLDKQPCTLTKAELLDILKEYPDELEIRIVINRQDMDKATTISESDVMPRVFELSKLSLFDEEQQCLKINAWVHVSRLPVQHKVNMSQDVEDNEEGELIKRSMIGWVKWFNVDKGIGFLQCDDITDDIFVYYKNIVGNREQGLEPGSKVEFSLYRTSRGARASQVQLIALPQELLLQREDFLISDMID